MIQTSKLPQRDRELVKAIVVGTSHEYQRHQDKVPESEEIRARFKKYILDLLTNRGIDLIAEEAGNDEEVWAALRAEEAMTPAELAVLFEGKEIVDAAQRTIASVAAEQHRCRYVDIRSPNAASLSIAERDIAMAKATASAIASCFSVLVIVGKDHMVGIARILENNFRWAISVRTFPEDQHYGSHS